MKTFKYIIFLAIISFLFACSKSDDNQEDENQSLNGLTLINEVSIGGAGDEFGIDVVKHSEGFIICGVNNQEQPYIVSVDENFEILWEQHLGISGVGGFEKVIATQDGNFVAAGFTEFGGNDLDMDLYIVKLDSEGSILWSNTLGSNYINDTTVDLIEASNGDLIIAGTKLTEPLPDNFLNTTTDIIVARINESGNLLWSSTYGSNGNETLSSVIEMDNGDLLVGGSLVAVELDSNGNVDHYLPGDIWIFKINANGGWIEDRTYGSPESDGAPLIQKLHNGNLVVLANINGTGNDVTSGSFGEIDVWLFTLNNALNITSQISLGGAGYDIAKALVEMPNSGFYIVGDSNSNIYSSSNVINRTDYWIVKLSSNFSKIDELYAGGSESEGASDVVVLDNRLFVIGSSNSNDGDISNSNGSWDIWLTVIEDN